MANNENGMKMKWIMNNENNENNNDNNEIIIKRK